jgi:serine/threonine protein kinase
MATSVRPWSKVGQGTYSTVYKAIDMHLNRTVALKKIRLEHLVGRCRMTLSNPH